MWTVLDLDEYNLYGPVPLHVVSVGRIGFSELAVLKELSVFEVRLRAT